MLTETLRRDILELIESENPQTFSSIDWRPFVGKVPDALIEIWKDVGSAAWGDRSYQSVNPELYKGVVDQALRSSPVNGVNAIPYIMTAFGRLTAWHPDYGLINIPYSEKM